MEASLSLGRSKRTEVSLRTLQSREPVAVDLVRLLLQKGHSRLFRECTSALLRHALTESKVNCPVGKR
jgi:hypothetical protein